MEQKCQGLIQKNAKLSQQVVGKISLQGTRHLVQDQIIIDADKFQPYIDFIEDQENAMIEAKKKVLTILGEMQKRIVEKVENVVAFLSSL